MVDERGPADVVELDRTDDRAAHLDALEPPLSWASAAGWGLAAWSVTQPQAADRYRWVRFMPHTGQRPSPLAVAA